jgi:hypothetical protein
MAYTGQTRGIFYEKSVNISKLKTRVAKKFPNSEIANILLSEIDTQTAEEFIAKAEVWLSVVDMERNKNVKREIEKEEIK